MVVQEYSRAVGHVDIDMKMGAFIIAMIIFAITIAAAILIFFGTVMSDNAFDGDGSLFITVFIVGIIISLLVASTHYLPNRW